MKVSGVDKDGKVVIFDVPVQGEKKEEEEDVELSPELKDDEEEDNN